MLLALAGLAVIFISLAVFAVVEGRAREEESEKRVKKLAERLRGEAVSSLNTDLENARDGNTTAVEALGVFWQMDYVCLDWVGNRYGVVEVEQGFVTDYAAQSTLRDLPADCFEVSKSDADRRLSSETCRHPTTGQ